MAIERLLIIAAGAAAMLVSMLLRRKLYPEISLWKIPIISVLLTISGVLGAMLMFYVENGRFGGTSFFGAILFAPFFMVVVGLVLRVPYGRLMDLCASAECLMLAILKFDCMLGDCCSGRTIATLGIQFPSQFVEMMTSLIIMLKLVQMENQPRHRNTLYCHYLIMYGVTRFVWNFFRDNLSPFVGILPPGHFWSVVSTVIGLLLLLLVNIKEKRNIHN